MALQRLRAACAGKENDPDFTIRVHAGENALFAQPKTTEWDFNNVQEAALAVKETWEELKDKTILEKKLQALNEKIETAETKAGFDKNNASYKQLIHDKEQVEKDITENEHMRSELARQGRDISSLKPARLRIGHGLHGCN